MGRKEYYEDFFATGGCKIKKYKCKPECIEIFFYRCYNINIQKRQTERGNHHHGYNSSR